MTKPEIPYIGISKAVDRKGGYVITAEYKSGYLILERFATKEEARAALPRVRRKHAKTQL